MWVNVFKNGPSKIYGRQPLKHFTWFTLEYFDPCIDIYKTVNNLKLEFMRNLFKFPKTNKVQRQQYKLNLEIQKSNKVSFGTKSLRIQGPKVWNA